MFQSMKNINSAFNYVRLFTAITVIGAFVVAAYSVSKISDIATLSKQQMLTIDTSGNLYPGVISSREANIFVEAESHVKDFHSLFFSFDPDREIINEHRDKWTYLSDNSAVVQYKDLEESGYYRNIIVSSISSRLEDIDILIDKDTIDGYLTFKYAAKQKLSRATNTSYQNLITKGKLRIMDNRSTNNPHALLIENWEIIDNLSIK